MEAFIKKLVDRSDRQNKETTRYTHHIILVGEIM